MSGDGFTHCSDCGRKIWLDEIKLNYQSSITKWRNHARDCSRRWQKPDIATRLRNQGGTER